MTREEVLELRCYRYKNIIKKYIPRWCDVINDATAEGLLSVNDVRFLHNIEEINEVEIKKPPLDLPSKRHWLIERAKDLSDAIHRYCEENQDIPKEWVKEFIWLMDVLRNTRNEVDE